MPVQKSTILVVEDEKDLYALLRTRLKAEGYRVLTARSGEAGLAEFAKRKPDLIILDVVLPRMDGWEFIRRLRAVSDVPVIFLTGCATETDRVLGLKLGADDYLTKPFSMKELSARVELRLRKNRTPDGVKQGWIKAGQLRLDFRRQEFRVNGRTRELTPKEIALLRVLVEAEGAAVSRLDLLRTAWGIDCAETLDTRTVDQHVARLRGKLGRDSSRVVTVKKMGYRFVLD